MPIAISHLSKRYVAPDGTVVPVIEIAELYLADGEQVALIGTSGSGKTTLLHMIAGIVRPDGGHIIFSPPGSGGVAPALVAVGAAGHASAPPAAAVLDYQHRGGPAGAPLIPAGSLDLVTLSEADRDVFRGQHIGYIFQTHHLLPGFTALENVLLGMSFTGRKADRGWAERLLAEVGLSDRIHFKPEKLSVGQQQRVAVARALANRPQLVLADEPTGALDARNAQHVLELIRNLCREVNATLLLVTHDLDIARQLPRVLTLAEINTASTAVGAPARV